MMSSPPIFLRLNSISLFPPTCSFVAEYKCPNTAMLYTVTVLPCCFITSLLFPARFESVLHCQFLFALTISFSDKSLLSPQ